MSATIPDSIWLILLIWLGLLALSIKEKYLGAMGALIGILFGLLLMPLVNQWLGLIVIFVNFYILYATLFSEGKQK
jgi:uncharacterized membrane protein